MKYLITGILVFLIFVNLAFAGSTSDELPIETTVPFLTISTDSRGSGMGDIGACSTPDLNSQYWNAAKYVFMDEKYGGSISFTPWLHKLVDDINLLSMEGYYKLDDRQSLSASLKYFDLGTITRTYEDGSSMGETIHPHEWAFDVAYGLKLGESTSAALTLRYIHSDITNGVTNDNTVNAHPGRSVAADLNVYYDKDIELFGYGAQYAFGGQISNIGAKMSYNDDGDKNFIPTNLRLGNRLTYEFDDYNKLGFLVEFNKLLVPTPVDSLNYSGVSTIEGMFSSFTDAPGGLTEELHELTWSVGLEYWYLNQFAIRAGYFNEYETKGDRKYYTAGFGLKLNVLTFDLSYLIPAEGGNHPLANTMRFTLGFQFKDK